MKLLVIGQTPPPYGGQSINIARMRKALSDQQIDHRFIRMHFSNEMSDMGAANTKKIWRLVTLSFRILKELIFYRPDYVYYPPAGPDKNPVMRDMALLFPVRLFGFKRIFHYHAGGVSAMENVFGGLLKKLFRFTYHHAAHSICLSESGKIDPINLLCNSILVIPSGVEDPGRIERIRDEEKTCTVLFAGVCRESKGILDFIEVIRRSQQRTRIKGIVIGNIFSSKEQEAIDQAVKEGLIDYRGLQTGQDKTHTFREADLLLFPSFFEAENFPTVILEAFSFSLPVVSTYWRGIPDIVQHGTNGFLHEIHAVNHMTDTVVKLATDTSLYQQISIRARQDFETKYTLSSFERSITNFFKALG